MAAQTHIFLERGRKQESLKQAPSPTPRSMKEKMRPKQGGGRPRGTEGMEDGAGTESRALLPGRAPTAPRRLTSSLRPAQRSPSGGSDHGHAEPVRVTGSSRLSNASPAWRSPPGPGRGTARQSLGHICDRNKHVPRSGARRAPRRAEVEVGSQDPPRSVCIVSGRQHCLFGHKAGGSTSRRLHFPSVKCG